jgi:mRNA interferase MazF
VSTVSVPDTGDLIWLTFDAQAGREQAGRRPALVLSPKIYNAKSGLALVCPLTSPGQAKVKQHPFEVAVPAGAGATGVILADSPQKRRLESGRCTSDVMDEARAKLAPLLGY